MTNRQIGSLACKLLALAMGLRAVQALILAPVALILLSGNRPEIKFTLMELIAPLVSLGFAFILWKGSDRISDRMSAQETTLSTQITAAQLEAIAFAVVGLFVLADSSANVGQIVGNVLRTRAALERLPGGTYPPSFDLSTQMIPVVIVLVLKIAAGLFLLLRSTGLAKWMKAYRDGQPG